MLNRRELVRAGLAGGAVRLLPGVAGPLVPRSFWDDPTSPPLTPFVAPLPLPPTAQPVVPFAADCSPMPYAPGVAGPGHTRAGRTRRDRGPAPPGAPYYYRLAVEEAFVSMHPELPPTKVWRYRDTNVAPGANPFAAGPTFKVFMNQGQVVRFENMLPANHTGFGVPRMTTHLHGGHMEARSDGFPEDIAGFHPVFGPGEHYDYCYAMRDVGFSTGEPDPGERPSTLWYHDHLLDFTGPNVYRGLSGFYLVFDELDAGDETKGLRLPSGEFDVPLVLQDRLFAPDGSLVYLPGSFDGFLGDRFLVNGAVQPFFHVKRRKYRFRILNGSNARFYALHLTDPSRATHPFDMIANEGGLFAAPMRDVESFLLSMAERREIVIDFAAFPEGTVLYLEDRIDQDDGRGPGGDFDEPDMLDPDEGRRLLKFVVGGPCPDPSMVPDTLRPFDPIPAAEIAAAERHHFEFERTGGAWAINDEFVDIDVPCATPALGVPQVWTLENKSGGWWHPIHVHLEFMRVLSRNGGPPTLEETDGFAKKDTVVLGPNDELEVFLKFRDFPGNWVFHCHNIEHEDHFMMCRFDVV